MSTGSLAKNLNDVLYFHPAATVFIHAGKMYLNHRAREITGYTDADFKSWEDWFRVVFREEADKVRENYQMAKETGFSKTGRIEFPRKDGQIRVFDFKVSVTGDTEVWHIDDVTDLILSEERFSILFNHSMDPYLIADTERVIDCNEATIDILGAKNKKEILDLSLYQFSPEKQPCGALSDDKIKTILSKIFENGRKRFDWVFKKLNGDEIQMQVSFNPVSVGGKRVLLVCLQDMTEAKSSQAKMMTSAKMSTLGDMAANIAHEINNPLAVISAYTYRLEKKIVSDFASNVELLSGVEKINATVHRITKIIKGLRSFARDADDVNYELLDVNTVVMETLDICLAKMKNYGIQVNVDLKEGWIVKVQAVQVSQVIMNLISNSFDAVESLDEKWISISSELSGGKVRLRVTDSGFGIPEHIAQNMMRPFFTTKGVGKGTGLGLCVSKGIIEDHGGAFMYELVSGHTSFVIELPLVTQSVGPAEGSSNEGQSAA